jgi:hypothetical protein
MSKPISVQDAHLAEVERLRRLREAAPMFVSVELDESQVRFLGDLYDFNAEQRGDQRIMSGALQVWINVSMKLQEEIDG